MTFNLSSSGFGEGIMKLNNKNPRCCPLCKFCSCFSVFDIYLALKLLMPADNARECSCDNSVLQPTIPHSAREVLLSYAVWDTDSAARKNLVFFLYQRIYQYRCADQQTRWSLRNRQDMMQTGHFLPSACLQYDLVFLMVLIWSWVIIIHQCPLSVQGFRAILIWRDRPQEIWSLKMLLWLWLFQVNQELEGWFGNRIRYIVSDINLQQKGGKTKQNKSNQSSLLDPNIS